MKWKLSHIKQFFIIVRVTIENGKLLFLLPFLLKNIFFLFVGFQFNDLTVFEN